MTGHTSYAPAAAEGALRPLAALIAALDLAAAWALVALVAGMVILVSAQVFMRYALNSSIGWTDEVSRLTFVWSIFLAIPLGIKAGVHIGMEILTVRLPARMQDVLARVIALLGAAMMTLVSYQAFILAYDQWDELMASINMSAAWFIVPVAIGCAHSALHLLWITMTGKGGVDEELAKDLD
ncbi:MAG: TRAP transporter small permease [Betaproteobacteria bacterium]